MQTDVWRTPRVDWERSDVLYECRICGAYTDLVKVHAEIVTNRGDKHRHYHVCSSYSYCPNEGLDWHVEIYSQMQLLLEKPHPKSYSEELIGEILATRNKHKQERKDDVQGAQSREKKLIEPCFPNDDGGVRRRVWGKVSPLLRREITEQEKR